MERNAKLSLVVEAVELCHEGMADVIGSLDDELMEMLGEGNVKEFASAFQLACGLLLAGINIGTFAVGDEFAVVPDEVAERFAAKHVRMAVEAALEITLERKVYGTLGECVSKITLEGSDGLRSLGEILGSVKGRAESRRDGDELLDALSKLKEEGKEER